MAVATRRSTAPKKASKKAPSRSRAPAKAITPPLPSRSARPRRNEPVVPETPSPGTLSPSVIEEADVEAPNYREQVLELKERLAEYEHDRHKQYRVHKSRSRRHHRHRRHYSSESSTDSEEGDGPRVSFMHAEGTRPFLNLHERYRAVEIKYFKQIFFGRSNPKTSPSWAGDTLIALVRTALTKPMGWYTCYSVSRCMARPYATMHTPQWPSTCRRNCQIIVFAWLSCWPRTNLTPFASITVRS